jgi:hypothetical protein
MRLLLAAVMLLVFVPMVFAQTIGIWDDDRGDVLPGIGGTEIAIYNALDALGYHATILTSLPPSLDGYDAFFSLHGWYDC